MGEFEEIDDLRRQLAGLRAEIGEVRSGLPMAMAALAVPPPSSQSGVDTSTRHQGVYARHRVSCPKTLDRGRRCRCRPSYYGVVWDSAIHGNRRTGRRGNLREAKLLRDQLVGRVSGVAPSRVSFEDAKQFFVAECRAGVALNKRGEPYKPNAIRSLDSALKSLPELVRRKRFGDVAGWDLQFAVDEYRRRGLSSSRIHSIVCAVRSLYTWGIQHGMVAASPVANIQLPAVRFEERTRIATPGEFAALLEPLAPHDALPWALAAYGTARHQEIRILGWLEVDFEEDVILLADDDRARKSEAARRVVPMAARLRRRLLAEWFRQGQPEDGPVCPPRRTSTSGLISLGAMSKRVAKTWRALGFEPIGLQDARHTAATWLDHAGVSPKVASALMGHKTPGRDFRFDAAPITLRRYTHVLPGELERARDQLDAFLSEREREEADGS